MQTHGAGSLRSRQEEEFCQWQFGESGVFISSGFCRKEDESHVNGMKLKVC